MHVKNSAPISIDEIFERRFGEKQLTKFGIKIKAGYCKSFLTRTDWLENRSALGQLKRQIATGTTEETDCHWDN